LDGEGELSDDEGNHLISLIITDGNVNPIDRFDDEMENGVNLAERGHAGDENAMVVEEAENPTNSNFCLDTQVLRLLCNLRGNSTVTGATLATVLDEFGELINLLTYHLKHQVKTFLNKNNLLENCPNSEELLKIFDIGNPFVKVRTIAKQDEALEKNFNLIKPVEVLLGDRIDYSTDGSQLKSTKHVNICLSLRL